MNRADLIPLEVSDRLREIDLPEWEGLPFQYVKDHLTEDYRCWKQRPHEFQMGTVSISSETESSRSSILSETWGKTSRGAASAVVSSRATVGLVSMPPQPFFPVIDLYQRAADFWQELLPQHVGKTVLIVSHGGTNHALISAALGISPTRHHTLQQSNCGISALHFPMGAIHAAQLESLNLTGHLGEMLPKLKEGKQGYRLLLLPSDAIAPLQEQYLTEQLKGIQINFCLLADADRSEAIAHKVLNYHPETVQIHALRDDFATALQGSILSRSSYPEKLITGLIIAPKALLKTILSQAVSGSSDYRDRLQVQSGTLSVLHYPGTNHPPILQASNWGYSATRLR
jgi:phosphoserine phosphatase